MRLRFLVLRQGHGKSIPRSKPLPFIITTRKKSRKRPRPGGSADKAGGIGRGPGRSSFEPESLVRSTSVGYDIPKKCRSSQRGIGNGRERRRTRCPPIASRPTTPHCERRPWRRRSSSPCRREARERPRADPRFPGGPVQAFHPGAVPPTASDTSRLMARFGISILTTSLPRPNRWPRPRRLPAKHD